MTQQMMTQKTKTHEDMIKFLFSKRYHSVFLGILGPNQSGKTVTALYLMSECHRLGLYKHFGANIPDLKLPFQYDFIEDLETLKERCSTLNANGVNRYLYLADEMGDWAPQDQPWLNVKFVRELQKVRKYGLSMIGCGIARIDKRILSPSYFNGYFEKMGKKNPDRAIYYDWVNYPSVRKYKVYDLPNLVIDGFDTYSKSDFFMQKQNTELNSFITPELMLIRRYFESDYNCTKAGIPTNELRRAWIKQIKHDHPELERKTTQEYKENSIATSQQIAS